jgi:hypothetical protein
MLDWRWNDGGRFWEGHLHARTGPAVVGTIVPDGPYFRGYFRPRAVAIFKTEKAALDFVEASYAAEIVAFVEQALDKDTGR